jgi:hypothetical protein
MLAANINRLVKAALKAVNKETREKARLLYANAGRRAPQLHTTRNTNPNPVIASLRRTRLLLLKFLRRPDSAAKADQAADSPAPASEAVTSNQKDSLEKPVMRKRSTTTAPVTPESPAEQLPRVRTETVGEQALELRSCAVLGTSDLHLHVRSASEARSSPSVSPGGVLLIARDNASDFAATPAPVAVTAIASSLEIAASTFAPKAPKPDTLASAPKSVPLPPVDGGGRQVSGEGTDSSVSAVVLHELLWSNRSLGFEGWSGVERTSDKTSADGRTVGGGQDMAGLSSFPIGGGRGGREFLPTRRKLLAPTLALPDY